MTDLSFIIPCYNEEPHLKNNLEQVVTVLEHSTYSYEVIIIDDASTDKTPLIIDKFITLYNGHGNIVFIKHPENLGRGESVKNGLMAAKGTVAGFVDIDLSTSPWYILPLAAEIENGADIAIGSRMYKLKWKVFHRWILSKGYKVLVRIFLGTDLGDTETGCKFFKRERIIPILSQVKDQRWFWDTEIMARALMANLKIVEVPTVFIRESLYSRVKIIRDSWQHLTNLTRLSWKIRKSLK